ncbi:FAD-binding type 2 [Penicillium paradoxum]|uniref:FAD-binding type 2 n=1 Tax=Penicillium paradoxum TaxID=176176 RepID=UPI002547F4BD|nr:FAD-binding type 2 [Penicillium paradoxum]KAJ5773702.1 FAD-binding type 2 [Penicillium paradoxum]
MFWRCDTANMLPLALTLAGIFGPIGSYASEPGPSACSNITTQLGSSKVVTRKLSLKYITSTEYWSTPQGKYKPSCIIYPESSKDVSVVLQAVRAADSRFAIKGGGHNPNKFFSSTDKGVLIDLTKLNKKSYDPETTLATYEPGGVFGDIYEYFEQYNRTVVGARLSGVGTGLALGGGMSYLSPQYGMACDSFRELEIVLPDGQIVTASNTSNPDLFFASRGGGGNAYGVVTKYTVQSRPIGEFFAGNLIYAFPQKDTVIEAISDFIRYNTDPKASIIGTYEKLPTPNGNLNLDEAIIMFLVYDGPDPGDAFKNFTSISSLLDTTGIKTYAEIADMPIPISTEISRGGNHFRVGVHRADNDECKRALDIWRNWAEKNKGKYFLLSLDYQPVPKSLTDASKAQGGNAMDMPDGPWFWLNYLLTTLPGMSQPDVDAIQSSFRDMVKSTTDAEGLPLFINDAAFDQKPLSTFSTYAKLQEIKKKYDPDNFFADKTGGWSFD